MENEKNSLYFEIMQIKCTSEIFSEMFTEAICSTNEVSFEFH